MRWNDTDGSTHHYACDCREKYFKNLEKAADELAKAAKNVYETAEEQDPFWERVRTKYIFQLEEALSNFEKVRGKI